MNDGYEYGYEVMSRNIELKNYVENGGGILFTYDSLEAHNDYPELEEVVGVDDNGAAWINMYSVEIVQEHEILQMPYELRNDGKVNYLDLAILGASYGLSEGVAGYNQDADLNHDGIVNYLDLAMLGANYGKSI